LTECVDPEPHGFDGVRWAEVVADSLVSLDERHRYTPLDRLWGLFCSSAWIEFDRVGVAAKSRVLIRIRVVCALAEAAKVTRDFFRSVSGQQTLGLPLCSSPNE